MLRNGLINSNELEAGPFERTAQQCSRLPIVLAIQDTTTLTVATELREQLGSVCEKTSPSRGMLVHST